METQVSLLNRLKFGDAEQDWERFYYAYADMIVRYARKLGLDENAAYDVLQDTMVALMSVLKRFEYDPKKGKFRSFLFTIVRRSTFRQSPSSALYTRVLATRVISTRPLLTRVLLTRVVFL